jgi:hypothetical protein
MVEPDREQQKAIREAEEKGRERAALEAKLSAHDAEIRRETEARGRLEAKVEGVAKAVDKLSDQFREQQVRESTITEQAQEAISRQVTRREFWYGIGTLVVAVLAATATVLATVVAHA